MDRYHRALGRQHLDERSERHDELVLRRLGERGGRRLGRGALRHHPGAPPLMLPTAGFEPTTPSVRMPRRWWRPDKRRSTRRTRRLIWADAPLQWVRCPAVGFRFPEARSLLISSMIARHSSSLL